MLPIEYNVICVSVRAYLYIIRTNSHNSPTDKASINLKIAMYHILDSKEIHEKIFFGYNVRSGVMGHIGAKSRANRSSAAAAAVPLGKSDTDW